MGIAQELAFSASEDDRYEDHKLSTEAHPGEITDEAISQFQDMLIQYSQDREALSRWLAIGSTSLYQEYPQDLLETVKAEELPTEQTMQLSPFCRSSYVRMGEQVYCFINGQEWQCSLSLAQRLTAYAPFLQNEFEKQDARVLTELINLNLIQYTES